MLRYFHWGMINIRHAKRRAKLYKLPESAIEEILEKIDLADGEYEIIRDVILIVRPISDAVPGISTEDLDAR